MKNLLWLLLLGLNGCATLAREEFIAMKSYELGCVHKGSGSPMDSYDCHKAAERFQKQLHAIWMSYK